VTTPMPVQARVLVVDDHPIVRQGLTQLINREGDLRVCGEADCTAGALQAIEALRPDVVVADLSLQGPDGLELLKNLRGKDRAVPVVILSMHDESLYAERALRAGARAYLMKQEATETVLIAIRRVLAGEIYLSDRMASRLLRQFVRSHTSGSASPVDLLSDRELEVFGLIGRGRGTRQIAEELHLSIKTVESYRAHIKDKLEIGTASELVRHAVQWVEGGSRASGKAR
jgi:DNA-binding NarL/FixJ family response regulator